MARCRNLENGSRRSPSGRTMRTIVSCPNGFMTVGWRESAHMRESGRRRAGQGCGRPGTARLNASVHVETLLTVRSEKGNPMIDNRNFYWDWIRREDGLFADRTNLFLVGEIILLAATFVAKILLFKFLCVGDIVVSVAWLWVNISHTSSPVRRILTKLESVEARWRGIRIPRGHWGCVDKFVGLILPTSFRSGCSLSRLCALTY